MRKSLSAFTLVELLVVLTLLAMLVALLFPVFAVARDRARGAACSSNLRQMATALAAYTQDHDGHFPVQIPSVSGCEWARALLPYTAGQETVFHCPSCVAPGGSEWRVTLGYALNSELFNFDHRVRRDDLVESGAVPFPSTTIAFCEVALVRSLGDPHGSMATADWRPNTQRVLAPGEWFVGGAGALRHQGGSYYAFVDGHVRWLPPDQVRPSTQTTGGRSPGFSLE